MIVVITMLHVLVCVALIGIVLLQAGKGADIGAAFGAGSSQTMFGTRGAATFLQKATAIAAVTFMLPSLTLTYMANRTKSSSVVSPRAAPPAAPAPSAPTGAPGSTAPPGAFPNAPPDTGEPGLPGTPAPVVPGIPAPGTPAAPAPTAPPAGGAPGNR